MPRLAWGGQGGQIFLSFLKKLIKLVLKISIVKKIAFWGKSHYIAFDHHRRYPTEPRWYPVSPSPIEKYDALSVQIGHRFFVIGGYTWINQVCSFVDVFDLKLQKWIERFDMPVDMSQSHLAITSDGSRFVYAISGQLGPECSPAVREGFVYDVFKKEWHSLPPLPEPRYAATMQLWRGRLHVVGGSIPDRYTPACDHWSIAIKDGRAIENVWRKEISVPRGAMHRPSAIIDDVLYVFGGQAGDFIAMPQSPCFQCDGNTREDYFAETYRLKTLDSQWEKLADMLIGSSHTECSVIVRGTSMIVLGGQIFKDPKTFQLKLTDAIQKYDAHANQWTIIGHLPYGLKTTMVAYYDGWVYATTGQRDRGLTDASPGRIDRRAWRTKIIF